MPPSKIKISDLVQPRLILDLPPVAKGEAIEALCRAVSGDPRVLDGEELLRAMLQRESEASTGIGLGLAIPHVKIPQVSDFILAVGRSREGIEFDTPDGTPVHLIFMLAASNRQTKPFIHLLAGIPQVLRDEAVRQELLEAGNPESFARICGRYEW